MARVWLCALGLLLAPGEVSTKARGESCLDWMPGGEPSAKPPPWPRLRHDGAAGPRETAQEGARQRNGRWWPVSNAAWFFLTVVLIFFLGFCGCLSHSKYRRWLLGLEEEQLPPEEEVETVASSPARTPPLETFSRNARTAMAHVHDVPPRGALEPIIEEGMAMTQVHNVPPRRVLEPIIEEETLV